MALIRYLTQARSNGRIGNLTRITVVTGAALVIVFALIGLILASMNKSPGTAVSNIVNGVLNDEVGRIDAVMMSLPLLLCASGLLLTFTAGLWNIGVEGQVAMGAIFATILARSVPDNASGLLMLPAELILAMIGGALWGALAAVLKTRGNVNEIFGGVALNFVAQNILIYLLSGPWKVGSYQQTAPFADPAKLPALESGSHLSLVAIGVTLIAFVVVFSVLRGTRWGLQLKAMGHSERSAFLLGVRTNRNVLLSMMACGAIAGLAGAYLILAPNTNGRLFTSASGGVGFLGLLIAMLINYQAAWIIPVALFFAIVRIGSLKLQSDPSLALDPSLGRVFQSALVLAVLLANGVRARVRHPRRE